LQKLDSSQKLNILFDFKNIIQNIVQKRQFHDRTFLFCAFFRS